MSVVPSGTSTDDLPPTPDPPPPSTRSGEVVCGFCETRCSARGEVIKLSTRAKQLRDYEDDLEDAKRTITDRDAEIAQLKRHNEELHAEIAATRKEKLRSPF